MELKQISCEQCASYPCGIDETKFDSTTGESHLLNVPFHILEMIMDHCFGEEYMNFRAACKRCYLAAPLTRLQIYSPWLAVLDNSRSLITFLDPMCGKKYSIKTPQELNGEFRILCSRYGWLLLCKFQGCALVFYNPFTNDIRKLPAVPCYFESVCFSKPPTSLDCIVVGFAWLSHVYFHFVSQEPPSWRRLDLDTYDPFSFHFPTFSGRDIYALCNNNKRIEVFRDMSKEDYSREVVADNVPRRYSASWTEYYLSKCDQHLLLVIVSKVEEFVEVFKLTDSTREWEKIDGLGNHMIYISNTSCICLEAKSPQLRNKIYFPNLLRDEDEKITFYSLETCKYHTFDYKNIHECVGVDLLRTYRYSHPHTWIEPTWS